MKKAKQVKDKTGSLGWICGCGSRLPALYDAHNIGCSEEERVCAWCFKKVRVERGR